MSLIIKIQGLVQGVGFRPFVCRVARELGLCGNVSNSTGGVVIEIERAGSGDGAERVRMFLERLRRECPPAASIHSINVTENPEDVTVTATVATGGSDTGFHIAPSHSGADEITQVAPDIAVCDDCLRDRETQPHRLLYPFINCTNCGPRFSIIKDLPYDRPRTTMAAFEMCPDCRREYDDPRDRRFHAQPVACNHCGPVYRALHAGETITDYARLLALTARLLDGGGIIAVKGVGGYHLACDATNERAVLRLREIKRRDSKPFAVLFRDAASAAQFAAMNPAERAALESWRRPIVLLRQRAVRAQHTASANDAAEAGSAGISPAGGVGSNAAPTATRKLQPANSPPSLAPAVNPGMGTLGCMTAYLPLHYDWFARLATPALVLTSGNLSDAPIAIDEAAAESQFGGAGSAGVDLFLHHNREIHNRADDSIVQICGAKTCVIRRSRGWAPEPFFADVTTDGVLAFGAEKTGAFALGRGNSVLMSQHIGDLKNWETFSFYEEALARFQRLFRFTPRRLVCDLHPDYLSTQAAEKMAAAKNLPLLRVQHHHAHAAACMLEHRLHEPLIAAVWDATGLGDDGKIWGGEFFLCDRKRYARLAHIENVPMPGGDKTALEPWRMAVSWLRHCRLPHPENFEQRIGPRKIEALAALLDSGINCPLTSSAGRLFDALASLLGICDTATRQAEAPVLLEQHAADDFDGSYPLQLSSENGDRASGTGDSPVGLGGMGDSPMLLGESQVGSPQARASRPCHSPHMPVPREKPLAIPMRPLIEGVLADMRDAVPTPHIAAKIHETLARLIVGTIAQLQRQTGATKALVTGGCFQNKRLTERVQTLAAAEKIVLYIPEALPANDSGIAAGQLAIATV